MSDPHDYTLGWICALEAEYVAAQELLDHEHEPPEYVSIHDTNDYTLGSIGKHNVVIAVLPEGEYGTSSAASVATNMLHSFPNVRVGVLVGIGGGAPSLKHDIRLGDIVVSASRDGMGGVFQYDFGKTIQGQSFQHTRFLNQPPTSLRTALTGIQAQYQRKGHQLEAAINAVVERNPRLRMYRRPPPDSDRLFKADVAHGSRSCAEFCARDPMNLVPRRERTNNDDNPAIHYGLIASANQLLEDAKIRDKLTAEKDVLCFDTEAAGLMNIFPCLIIRGICDYSDSHKNQEWRGYAALAAAAYAKALLSRIALHKVRTEKMISEIISESTATAENTASHIISAGPHESHPQFHAEASPRDATVDGFNTQVEEMDEDTSIRNDKKSRTPLQRAIDQRDTARVKQILENGADIDSMDNGGGKITAQRHLKKVVDIEAKDEDGWTPLRCAINMGSGDIVRLLLENGADIESKDGESRTPLHLAVVIEDEAMVRILLEMGADTESKDLRGRTPLRWAMVNKNESIIRLLLRWNVDIESKDVDGWTPLRNAINGRSENIVRLLLESGANIRSTDNDGLTTLSWAKLLDLDAMVKLLLQYDTTPGAD